MLFLDYLYKFFGETYVVLNIKVNSNLKSTNSLYGERLMYFNIDEVAV